MTTLPLAAVRADLSKLIDEAVATHQRVDITRNGRRAAVLLAADDYDSLIETLEVMSDPDLVRDIREAEADPTSYTLEEVMAEMRALGRLP